MATAQDGCGRTDHTAYAAYLVQCVASSETGPVSFVVREGCDHANCAATRWDTLNERTRQGHGVCWVDGPQVEAHQHLAWTRLRHRLAHDCARDTHGCHPALQLVWSTCVLPEKAALLTVRPGLTS